MPSHDPTRPYQQKLTYPVDEHPQLCVVETPLTKDQEGPKHVEYRLYNWRKLKSGRVVRGDGIGIGNGLIIGLVGFLSWGLPGLWAEQYDIADKIRAGLAIALLVLSVVIRTRTVLYQSVIPLPKLGLQRETTCGLSLPHPLHPSSPTQRLLFPISTSYTFIPLSQISTVVINEGLPRWNVRFYLAVIEKGGGVVVALDEVWAPIAVLREVYHGVRESLFDEYADPP